jgi:hypothetical protein
MIYDLIGTISKPTGKMLVGEDGFEYPEMVAFADENGKPYYHVNMLDANLSDTIDEDGNVIENQLKKHIVEVKTPSRTFAGRSDLVCLRFADRDEWLSMGIEEAEDEK